jgi:hypothetical protein
MKYDIIFNLEYTIPDISISCFEISFNVPFTFHIASSHIILVHAKDNPSTEQMQVLQ